MNEFSSRLETLFEYFSVTSSQFADAIGVQKSSISHILSERNKPSLDFILKIKDAFPEINLYWLIYGTDPFLISDPIHDLQKSENQIQESRAKQTEQNIAPMENNPSEWEDVKMASETFQEARTDANMEQPGPQEKDPKKIKFVMVFYEDDTFERFETR